jgi:hypothetical protein
MLGVLVASQTPVGVTVKIGRGVTNSETGSGEQAGNDVSNANASIRNLKP